MLTANWGRHANAIIEPKIQNAIHVPIEIESKGGRWAKSFQDFELTVRLQNCLMSEFSSQTGLPPPRCHQVAETDGMAWLLKQTPAMLLRIPNFGKKCLQELKEAFEDSAGCPITWGDKDTPLGKATVQVKL